jgi:hypothetical protein
VSRLAAVCLVAAAFAAPARADDAGVRRADAGVGPDEIAKTAPLARTSRPEDLLVRNVNVVIERKGDRLEVTETVSFASREGRRFVPRGRLRLALPRGAVAPKISKDVEEQLAAEVDAAGFAVLDDVVPEGGSLTVSFEVPIHGGRAAFAQRLPAAFDELEVISTWTRGAAKLSVAGCRPAVRDELTNGVTALVAMGRGLDRDELSVELSGIDDGPERFVRRAALAACLALLAWGVFAAAASTRRRRRKGAGP